MLERDPAVDAAAIGRLLETTGGDVDFLNELVDTYLEDSPAQLQALREAAESGDIPELVRPAHSLKSNSASMGAEILAALCRSLETEAKAGHVDDPVGRVAAAAAEFEAVRATLLAMRAGT